MAVDLDSSVFNWFWKTYIKRNSFSLNIFLHKLFLSEICYISLSNLIQFVSDEFQICKKKFFFSMLALLRNFWKQKFFFLIARRRKKVYHNFKLLRSKK